MNDRHSISIAVLTENQDDVALINGTLRDAGHAAHCLWIKHPKMLSEALATVNVEMLILNCDRYPDSIRQVIKQKDLFNPEVPVIALKEQADESSIEDAMKNGACDLITINLKKRIQSVVTRELRALRVERALNSTLQSATEYKRQLEDHMRTATSAIALVQDGIINEANEAWLTLFKYASNTEAIGLPLMDNFDRESQAAIKGALIATMKGKWLPEEQLIAQSNFAGEGCHELKLEFRRYDLDDGPCVQIRIAQPPQVVEEPTKLVHDALKRDPTTLFYHRTQFLDRIKKRLGRKPSSGLHALVLIKPDNFSAIRDDVGILNSEEILAQFAEVTRKRMHPRDIAGRFEGIGIMILLERGSARDAQTWSEQLVDHVRKQTFEVEEKSTQMTCTVGVCTANEIFATLEEFITATVEAHRQGKEAGGNSAVLSEAAKEDTKRHAFDAIWVKHLKSALMDDRFRLAQLPIAGLRSESIAMYDLLVRLLDEQGNSVLPSEFLPAAERNNMMKNIDRWMIKSSIDFCQNNNADRVFVRLSTQSMLDTSTAAWMEQEFDSCGFDCTRVVIQVPERTAAKHIKQTRTIVEKLRKLGVGFALEHYGVGKDHFQTVDILKPDYIKIDGELMPTLVTDTKMQGAVARIVQAATERRIKTIAERVETANAMAVLFQLGLNYMQGHYVHEPEVVLQNTGSVKNNTLAELVAANGN